jgi:SAM-dependent methyltransferase
MLMSHLAERLSPSANVAEQVRDFYERYPYPPPVDCLEEYQRHWQDPQRRRADFHLYWPGRSYREDRSILIAGCGTSQAAKHALRWPAAEVTGIDCSAASVQHTAQLKTKHGIRNLKVHELKIEDVRELGMSFDEVVCTGVLHHLADPVKALNALRSVLKPGGAMQLMVYAPYGRAGVYMLQEFCRGLGIEANGGEIRDLTGALHALPAGHPLQGLLSKAKDFQNESALADTLLHPQDRAYSVPQFLELIEKGGLTFGRWIKQAPYSVHCGVMAKIPQSGRIERLSPAEQYAMAELFRGTMVRHSAIVYAGGGEDCAKQQPDFADGTWLACIPIRMPATICVQDALCAGAVAVLINQSHTDRDLFLPISRLEKEWFDAIDGARSIREIVDGVPSPAGRTMNLAVARTFFKRLWWNDQVVFDSSRANSYRPSRTN